VRGARLIIIHFLIVLIRDQVSRAETEITGGYTDGIREGSLVINALGPIHKRGPRDMHVLGFGLRGWNRRAQIGMAREPELVGFGLARQPRRAIEVARVRGGRLSTHK